MKRAISRAACSVMLCSVAILAGCKSDKSANDTNGNFGADPAKSTDYNSRMGGNSSNNMGQAAPTTMGSNSTR